ncbi:MAG: glycine oxidase ThiO [Chlorobi bacterium]|nr:glycine oxidase ThiO [Chlorobiota bacterium]
MADKTIIIGGGIIGLSLGWQLVRRGADVEILERSKAGKSSSWAAAGMLAPQAEMGFEDIELFYLCRKSLEMYPRFLEELYNDSCIKAEYDKCGAIMPAFDRDDSERIRRLFDFREKIGLPVQWLTGSEAREIEPYLSPKCTFAVWMPEDGQIDNRKLLETLRTAFINAGGKLYEDHLVERINIKNGKAIGVHIHGIDIEADKIIVCAGSWSKMIEGIPEEAQPPVRPVKGQAISLIMDDTCKVTHAVRAPDAYLVPKKDGRLIVGASVEEMGFDEKPTAGEIFRILERAWEAVPSIYDLKIQSIDVGLRPGSRDHEPIIGDSDIEGLYFATGHYRNGILLTPVTAYELAEWIISGNKSETLARFNISRFHKETVS